MRHDSSPDSNEDFKEIYPEKTVFSTMPGYGDGESSNYRVVAQLCGTDAGCAWTPFRTQGSH